MMVELFAVQAADHQEVVGHTAEVRQPVGKLHAALAVLREGSRRAHQRGGVGLDEGEAGRVEDRLGKLLAVKLVEPGFGCEEVELRRRTGHEDENAGLGLRLKVRRLRLQGRGSRGIDRVFGPQQPIIAEHRPEGHRPQATGSGGEKLAAGAAGMLVDGMHDVRAPRSWLGGARGVASSLV